MHVDALRELLHTQPFPAFTLLYRAAVFGRRLRRNESHGAYGHSGSVSRYAGQTPLSQT